MIYILGAGAMGLLWAAHLQKTHRVSLLVPAPYAHAKGWIDSPQAKNIRADQSLPPQEIEFRPILEATQQNATTLTIPCSLITSTLSEGAVILVTTKSHAVASALASLKIALNVTHRVILFQNGLGSQQKTCELLGDIPCYAAVTTEAANIAYVDGKKQVRHAGSGLTSIGPLNPAAQQSSLEHLMNTLGTSGINIEPEPDIWRRLWHKLVINCAINPFTAIARCPNGEVQNQALFQSLWPDLKMELVDLLDIAGHPLSEEQLEALVFKVMNASAENRSSMLQDIEHGRKTEINDINGFACRLLQSHQRPCNNNLRLLEAVNALGN